MVPGGGQEVLIRSTLVRAIIRWAGRVAILSLAGAIVATTVYFSVALDPIHPADSLSRNAMVVEPFRHRSLDPQPANLMEFVRHFIAVGVVALVGRKILRLRL